MRILSFSSVYPNPTDTGLGVFVHSRLQQMALGAEMKVIAPVLALDYSKRSWNNALPQRRSDGDLEVLHPRWVYLPGTGALTALALFAEMAAPVLRLRKEFPFQVIDAHYGYPEGIVAALISKVTATPFTVTLRGSELLHSRYRLRRFLMSWALRRAARVIAVSEELRRHAISLGVDPARTCTIPNGVDSTCFYPRNRQEARRQLDVAEKAKIILTAGHLIELKGHHRAVAALKQLHERGVDAQLVIAGGAPGPGVRSFEAQIRNTINELGLSHAVRLTGHVSREDLSRWMSAADVLCLASSREGWPNVVAEALGCGTPVVAARVGAIPEILASEAFGYTVEPDDVPALANGLERALSTDWDREAIAAAARRRSWKQVAREVLEQMRQVIRESSRVENSVGSAGKKQ